MSESLIEIFILPLTVHFIRLHNATCRKKLTATLCVHFYTSRTFVVALGVILNSASDYRTNELYRTPNPNPIVSSSLSPIVR